MLFSMLANLAEDRHSRASQHWLSLASALDILDKQGVARAEVIRLLDNGLIRSEEHKSELQSLMRTSYAVLGVTKKNDDQPDHHTYIAHKHTANSDNKGNTTEHKNII